MARPGRGGGGNKFRGVGSARDRSKGKNMGSGGVSPVARGAGKGGVSRDFRDFRGDDGESGATGGVGVGGDGERVAAAGSDRENIVSGGTEIHAYVSAQVCE